MLEGMGLNKLLNQAQEEVILALWNQNNQIKVIKIIDFILYMHSCNLRSMTIFLQQYNIEKLVNKIQQNCEERNSIRYKSEAEDLDFFVSKP